MKLRNLKTNNTNSMITTTIYKLMLRCFAKKKSVKKHILTKRKFPKNEALLPMLWQQYQWVLTETVMLRIKNENGRISSIKT